uniref:Uncharacterized protein n=1 Tax=Leersia perrieri TaxID=77586 RepID=A0A0D9VU70_9ORYZ
NRGECQPDLSTRSIRINIRISSSPPPRHGQATTQRERETERQAGRAEGSNHSAPLPLLGRVTPLRFSAGHLDRRPPSPLLPIAASDRIPSPVSSPQEYSVVEPPDTLN